MTSPSTTTEGRHMADTIPSSPFDATFEQCRRQLASCRLSARDLGSWGEAASACWLRTHGWRIVGHNWHCRYGELDLIALSATDELAFVEIKTRRGCQFGTPIEAVGVTKQTNLRRAAMLWMLEADHHINHVGIRFDVIGVLVHAGRIRFTHVPHAF